MKYVYKIVCEVTIEAETQEKADQIFADEYSDNLNQFIVNGLVQHEDGKQFPWLP